MLTDHNFVTLATDVYSHGALILGQCLSSHRATRTLVVPLASHVSDLRTVLWRVSNKETVGNLISAMLVWSFQQVPRSGSPSPHFIDGSSLITESVSSWMLSNTEQLFDRKNFMALDSREQIISIWFLCLPTTL